MEQVTNLVAPSEGAAATAAGGGATRAASEAAGAGREGSTTISIFMGRSVDGERKVMRRERRKQIFVSLLSGNESKQKEQNRRLAYSLLQMTGRQH